MKAFGTADRKVVAIHGQVDAQRVLELIEQLDELVLAEIGGGKAIRSRDRIGGRRVCIVGVYVGQESAHAGRHAYARVLGRKAREMRHGLVDRLDAVANRELVYDLLRWLVKIHFPTVILFNFFNF